MHFDIFTQVAHLADGRRFRYYRAIPDSPTILVRTSAASMIQPGDEICLGSEKRIALQIQTYSAVFSEVLTRQLAPN
jgi:hypothetical protein